MAEIVHLFDPDPQRTAADPTLSAFVTANAGSGKTKTLIDRVARLLLAGAEPETILCVTYTKAAAAEMQRRLFDLLGGWSVASDEQLRTDLAKLQGRDEETYDEKHLSEARALFARALETPGGLKIQTIHAFCEKLLRRFPVEAGVSPGFRVLDDAASAVVADAARKAVAQQALGAGPLADAYARFSVALDFASFHEMFRAFEAKRSAIAEYIESCGGLAGVPQAVAQACGLDHLMDAAAIEADALSPPAIHAADWRWAAEALLKGSEKTDVPNGLKAAQVAEAAALGESRPQLIREMLFTQAGEPRKTCATKQVDPAVCEWLKAEQERIAEAFKMAKRARVAEDTVYALTLAAAYVHAHETEKARSGGLDFADLIERTCALLASRPAAAWVLYKLDGGIDHILVDEAQDTAPDQWRIVRALTGEFFAGEDRKAERRLERNIFVVGDEKQSIYSFQGAQPELLIHEFEFHRERASGAGFRFERVDLLASWRSTPQVLSFVDATFAPPELATAILPRAAAEKIEHTAMRAAHAGCVDIWPLEQELTGSERDAWDAPLDAESETSANRRLAEKIACEIEALIERGDAVFDSRLKDWRPATAGDVLILVRRRKALFEDILRALKRRKIPVAGADRLALSEHIVFDDLLALARFVRFPKDELTLAALLRSPFCEVSDESLYELAHGRGKESLWARLRRRGDERAEWAGARAFLATALEEALTRRPFEFYARLLGLVGADGRSMRQRLLTRLGGEAEDALDEFLAQVLAAEGRGVHGLEGLASAFASLDITVKREMEAGRDEVRVMTAHGAKGLEAPIVFLPETTLSRTARGSPLMETETEDGERGFLWCASGANDCEASAAARERRAKREEEEAYRLLYVALTRARDRLVLCGRLSATAKEENLKGWWGAVGAAFRHAHIEPHVRETTCGDMQIRRYGPDPRLLGRAAKSAARSPGLPDWALRHAAPEAFAKYAPPSTLGEDARAAAASPLSEAQGLGRFRRGDLIHRLLQILPDVPAPTRAQAARGLLERETDLTADQRREMAEAALSVLQDARFAEVFGPGSRAEAPIIGSGAALPKGLAISGRIDRLVVLPDRVLVVDFKTNRPSPARIEDADPAYIRQMALYAAVLAEVFPGRAIEAALVWTDGPKLMPIPEFLLAQSLAELGRNA
ncbi:double-strand break repair helicase AddA [Phenylobacterium sp.]|jgi:ATP-dependent helicase/nuclease subunit A|uniref:double-strand break repair helicase AddA n=1 Tax=Phenylobacterium sp. TaxID=1871053 RepID=UPI002E342B84|nr:double-strand break repair helicase AddA [Phenylobacterium sp.]HEX2559319.1 double-strand break repair helicase AddA [Phenylobacterium sp.]